MARDVWRKRAGGVLAALCVAAGASGLLAIGLLAPPNPAADRSDGPGAPSLAAGGTGSRGELGSAEVDPFDPFDPASNRLSSAAQSPTAATRAPTESFVHPSGNLPLAGEATASGCSAALEYLNAYAAPGFSFECPGNAGGHQAMTMCVSGGARCGLERLIVIADPCPNAYMNEASNSWALIGASDAPLDPYGSCS